MRKSRDVPVQVAHGWGGGIGGFGGSGPPLGMMMRSAAPMPMAMAYSSPPMMMNSLGSSQMKSLSRSSFGNRSCFAPLYINFNISIQQLRRRQLQPPRDWR